MALARGQYDSMYQAYFGEYRQGDVVHCLLGSRDSKKTRGQANENYLKRILPKLAIRENEHFRIDQLDGTCE